MITGSMPWTWLTARAGVRTGYDAERGPPGDGLFGQAKPDRFRPVEVGARKGALARLPRPPPGIHVAQVHDYGHGGVGLQRVLDHVRRRDVDEIVRLGSDSLLQARRQRAGAGIGESAGVADGQAHRAGEGSPAARHHRELKIAELLAKRGHDAHGVRDVGHEGQGQAMTSCQSTRDSSLAVALSPRRARAIERQSIRIFILRW
jgi:hypothetical protein